ncbi:MAG: hypothetical protein JWP58_1650, partial [Hymenobacter sp.]|nr:hypothetical protein [Hymenobacter sp.]
GFNARGGPGGGLVGGTGLLSGGTGSAGTGGTQTAGGTQGGYPDQYCYCTTYPADLGQGGGKNPGSPSRFAGGGGGGYYGGGATYNNGNGAGAGGGSSYSDPTLATNVQHTQGYQNGHGYARITYSFQPEAPVISLNNATTSQAAGSVVFSDGSKLTGNAGQFYWNNSTLRLGIGTNSPQAALHVAGSARIEGLGGNGTRMLTTDNAGNLAAQALPTDAQQLSIAGSTISLTNGGAVALPADKDAQALSISGSVISLTNGGSVTLPASPDAQQLSIAGSTISLTNGGSVAVPSSADNLGNHTATQNLNLNGNLLTGGGSLGLRLDGSGNASFGSSTRQMLNLWGTLYGLGVQNNTQYFRSGDSFAWFTGGAHSDTQFDAGGGTTPMVLKAGRLGIGTTNPAAELDVPNGAVHLPGDSWIRFAGDNKNYLRGTTILADDASGGRVGIGTANPSFPLDVQGSVTPGNYAYAFYAANNGAVYTGSTGGNTGPVSIRATGRILATEFNATSDARLKTVLGRSDRAADLGLLNKLRITDYTMRDRVQYGSRRFKKVIAQEVEQVFPQAVNQHTGFLPDVYVNALKAEAQADSLLVLTLPSAPAAHAGQRLKLITASGEIVATVKAASGATLTVRGARQLAGQPVFVFGLEHDDVRTVDYEALAMLNVSATQELARQLAELKQQNAALRQQQAASQAFQTRATAETTSLAERLQALESLLGAKASVK